MKLPHVDGWNERRRAIAAAYDEALGDGPVRPLRELPGRRHVYHLYVVEAPDRSAFQDALAERGVGTLVHYPKPVHGHPPYARLGGHTSLAVSEHLAAHVVSLPIYPELTDAEVEHVAARCATWGRVSALLAVKAAGRRVGLELGKFNPTNSIDAARPLIVRDQGVDLVIDAGANAGQWATELRAEGYPATSSSFEPFSTAYDRLTQAAARRRRTGRRAARARRLDRRRRAPRGGQRRRQLVAAPDARRPTCAPRPTRATSATERVRGRAARRRRLPAGERLHPQARRPGRERAVLDGAAETRRASAWSSAS